MGNRPRTSMPRKENVTILNASYGTRKVPHHEQQYKFTCRAGIPDDDFQTFWQEICTYQSSGNWHLEGKPLAPLPPTSRYGLAFSALKRGYHVEILTNVKDIEYVSKTPASLTGRRTGDFFERFLDMMKAQFEERKKEASNWVWKKG